MVVQGGGVVSYERGTPVPGSDPARVRNSEIGSLRDIWVGNSVGNSDVWYLHLERGTLYTLCAKGDRGR